jgi:hypothetical protein
MTVLQGFLTEHDGYDDAKVQQCAEGVLVGLKRCPVQAASGEIDQVAQELVRLAQNVEAEVDSSATAVARFEWGALVAGRSRP